MECLKFNINDNVLVKLTDIGVNILRERHEETNKMVTAFGSGGLPEFENIVDDEGYSSFQLWALMNIFGNHLTMGTEIPFETDILIPYKGK